MSDDSKVEFPPHKKPGPKPIEIDEKKLEHQAANFWTYEELAAEHNCCVDTLRDRFSAIIERGQQRGKASLRSTQFQLAMGRASIPAQYLRDHEGKLVMDEKSRPIKTSDFQPAVLPNVTMNIWMGKQHLGQSDKVDFADERTGFAFPKKPERTVDTEDVKP
jgi:hypothetical protein